MSGSSQPQIVLLCAAPGTELTAIANSLKRNAAATGVSARPGVDPLPTVHVWDLESRICGYYDEEAGPGGDVNHTMFEVVQKPRHELYECWKDRYSEILNDIGDIEMNKAEGDVIAHVVCMHLTWYNAIWKEFFSPVNILSLVNEDFPICHVVVLIDDVYDMFRRLQLPQSLYDDATMSTTEDVIRRLSKPARQPPEYTEDGSDEAEIHEEASDATDTAPAGSNDEDSRIRVQAVELALGELLSWRQAEMVRAESVARTLGRDLTLFATKHTRASLRLLAEQPDTPRVYLSHRISEPRRAVTLDGPYADPSAAAWSSVASEVNELHHLFAVPPGGENGEGGSTDHEDAPAGQVLINPTAIDELRFETDPTTLLRIPRLTPRWPLPSHDILHGSTRQPDNGSDGDGERRRSEDADGAEADEAAASADEPPPVDAHHVDIIAGTLPDDDAVASHAARSLSIHIASEVSFRDHFIVEHTPNLCVFRPFHCERSTASDPDWSGGVTEEVNHWSSYLGHAGAGAAQRRIAFVHSHSEIKARLEYIIQDNHTAAECQRQALTIIQDMIPAYPMPKAKRTGELSVLGTTDGESVALRNLGTFSSALGAASLVACHFAFSNMDRQHAGSYLLVAAEDDPRTGKLKDLASVVRRLNDFYAGGLSGEDVTSANARFFDDCDKIFQATRGQSLLLHTLDVAGADTDRARKRLGLA